MTVVENFKNMKRHWNRESRTWDDPSIVYIGRHNPTHNLPQSEWANPFKMGSEDQRESVIELYRGYIMKQIEAGRVNLEDLRNKTLVCWCSPQRCHGHVLVELLESMK